MTAIIDGEYVYAWHKEGKKDSQGGTELMTQKLVEVIDKELLEKFWIVSSRMPGPTYSMPEDKIRIFWAHDLAGDPANTFLSDKKAVEKFHKFVFVSNWQMQQYINRYNLPWDKCTVLLNAIDKIEVGDKPDTKDEIRLIYHPTPRRGLNILAVVFDALCEKYDNLRLDVYSSHALYGWEESDEEYKGVFDILDANPKVNNHGTVDQATMRKALSEAHIFAYPSTWAETSCRCLMEAMSAQTLCVHSNYGAMYETAANWTQMYQYTTDQNAHASMLYGILAGCIENIDAMLPRAQSAKTYADVFYTWESRQREWEALLQSLVNTIKDTTFPKEIFTIKTGS